MKRLQSVSQYRVRRWFLVLLLANALYILFAGLYLRPLTSGEIVKFELAKETPVAESIIQDWIANGKHQKAINSIYLDFLFILLYTSGLSVASIFFSRLTHHEILIKTGYFFSYLVIAAGICDVIENMALLRSLYGAVNNWNTILAYDMAATKFSLLIITVLFLGICLIFWGLRKIETRRWTVKP
jgi:hypothetical protein